ncbi:MAG: glutathione S-transferase N-terminal domain-containing protein [Oligoflexales bacterium]|nr:glutathione S-transferase N-terminal domain-containing protein [Oligoflexales bacterium]
MSQIQELVLFQGPAVWGIANGSPFCIKLEFFLRHQKIPYRTKMFNPQIAPRGKMPFVKWQGKLIGDSDLIIKTLCKDLNIELDKHLNEEQKHLSHALKRMLEEGTYFAGFWNRWMIDENWELVKQAYFSHLPPLLRNLLPKFLRKQVKRTCHGHGISRYEIDEIYENVNKDLASLDHFFSKEGPYSLEIVSRALILRPMHFFHLF